MVLTLDKFGRVLIPKKARQALRLEAGSKVKLTVDEATGTAKLKIQTDQEEGSSYIKYAEWGWPYLDVGPPTVESIDTVALIKSTRQDYLDRKFGLK